MSYKTDKVVSTLKKNIWVYLILWLIVAIVLIAPTTLAFVDTSTNGGINSGAFLKAIAPAILKFTTITEMFDSKYSITFLEAMGIFTAIYVIKIGQTIAKTLPKSEYDKKEHGSSDWCAEGEQYKVLNPKNGILLAKENYLPLNKRGNLNVLIVGRIRNW